MRALELDDSTNPVIYDCTRRFGAILENVTLDHRLWRVELSDARLTENTRATFPGSHFPLCDRSGESAHPHYVLEATSTRRQVGRWTVRWSERCVARSASSPRTVSTMRREPLLNLVELEAVYELTKVLRLP